MPGAGSLQALVVVPEPDRGQTKRWRPLGPPLVELTLVRDAAGAAARLATRDVDALIIDAIPAIADAAATVERLAPLIGDRPMIAVVPPKAGGVAASLIALAGSAELRIVEEHGPTTLCRVLRQLVAACRRAEQRRSQNRLDPVTGLANRDAFRERVQPRLDEGGLPSALAVLDIDGLATVNALLGRDTADRILALVGERLSAALEDGDQVASVGAGRFLCWSPLTMAPEEALVRTRRVLQAIARPFAVAGERFQLTASAGLALHPADAVSIEALMIRAEAAMYRAKAQGPGSYRLHQPLLVGAAPAALRKRAVVRRELERDGLELMYEPQLDLRTERPRAARLHLRTLADGALLRLAGDEVDDLALPVIRWMLEAAGRQMAGWLGHEVPLVPLVIDLPCALVRRSDVVEMIRRRLQGAGCHPAWFEVAVAGEPVGVDASDTAMADHLQALRDIGLRVSLSGCGGARSSFASLRHLPADSLELAVDLVQGQRLRASDATVLTSLMGLGLGLGLDVGAAGVDRPGLARQLKELGCDWASGAWVGAPMPAAAFSDWLSGGGTLMIAAS